MFVGLIILPVRLNKWSRGYNVANAHPREEEWSNVPQEMAGEPDVEKPSIISRQAIYGAGNFVISEFWYKGLDDHSGHDKACGTDIPNNGLVS